MQAAIDLPKGITHCRDLVKGQEPTQQYQIRKHNSNYYLQSAVYGNFAIIDTQTAAHLCALQNIPPIQFLGVVESSKLKQAKWSRKTLCIVQLSISIYGQYKDGGNSGDILGKLGAFLQHPSVVKNGIEYYNPQLYYPHGKQEPLTHLVGLTDADISANLLSKEVETVLASLDDCDLDSIDSDIDLMDVLTELRR